MMDDLKRLAREAWDRLSDEERPQFPMIERLAHGPEDEDEDDDGGNDGGNEPDDRDYDDLDRETMRMRPQC